jgi:hypothetical protein
MARKPASFREKLVGHAVLFTVCVAFPALFTWIAPVSWTTLTRHGDRVEARLKVCLLFLVPFRTEILSDVRTVDHFVRAGEVRRDTNTGQNVRAESEGALVLQGPGQEVVVPVSPASLTKIAGKVRDFLADTGATKMRFFAPANWKVSVIAGGAVCLLTVLYLVVIIGSIVFSSRRDPDPQ